MDMTTVDEYALHTKCRGATIERLGFLGDEITIRIECDTLSAEAVEHIGLGVIKSLHVREQVDQTHVDVYRGHPRALTRKVTFTNDTESLM